MGDQSVPGGVGMGRGQKGSTNIEDIGMHRLQEIDESDRWQGVSR